MVYRLSVRSSSLYLFVGTVCFLALTALGWALLTKPTIEVTARIPASAEWYLGYYHGGVDDYLLFHGLDGTAERMRRADVLILGNSRVLGP
jgi:hypothetical protein